MNTHKQKIKKVVPLHTEQTFYYWMTKSINRLKRQGNSSRILIWLLIVWNITLTIPYIKPQAPAIPQFDNKMNQQIMIEEGIPPFDLIPVPVSELI